MINFTKDINAPIFGSPYVEVEETTDGATKANNGKYYLTKEQIESRFTDGDFHLVYLPDAEFIPPPPPAPWSKQAHLAEINALHEAEFERRWMAAGYKTEEELSRAIGNPKNKFHAEAMLIDDYWWDGWDAIVAYGETLTEQPTETPEEFFTQLNGTL